ncbi:MAG TPA: MerR family transcriptional regulator [Rhodospirillales bacterium]|nr:MerR family transcriptional regulator [Rhodospirillales bacterium]
MSGNKHPRVRRLTIGALSKHTGCNIETIRYYERIGLLPEPPRTEGGHRDYDEDHLKRLAFVRRGRELGFTLDQIRGLLRLVDGGDFTCADVQRITLSHIAEIRDKISDLRKMERVLKEMVSKCEGGDIPECHVIDVMFASLGK